MDGRAKFLGFPNLVEHVLSAVSAGSSSSNFTKGIGNLKKKSSSKRWESQTYFNDAAQGPLVDYIYCDFSAITNIDKRVLGLACVNHNFDEYTLVSYVKTPSSTYRVRFNDTQIYHRLLPASIISSTNYTGAVSLVQSNPGLKLSGDANWVTPTVVTSNSAIIFSFDNITINIAGKQQYFDIYYNCRNNTGGHCVVNVFLYNGATKITPAILVNQNINYNDSGILSIPWSTTSITSPNVRIGIEVTATNANIDLGAVMWRADHVILYDSGTRTVPLPAAQNQNLVNLQFEYFLQAKPTVDINYVLFEWISLPNEGYSYIGNLIIGPGIILEDSNVQWGAAFRLDDASTSSETAGGQEIWRNQYRKKKRIMKVSLDQVNNQQSIKDFWSKLFCDKGKTGTFYVSALPDSGCPNEFSIYGHLNDTSDMVPTPGQDGELAFSMSSLDIREAM